MAGGVATHELKRGIDWHSLPNAVDTTPLSKNKGLKTLFFFTSIIYCGQFLSGFDGTILGSLQALDRWNHDLGYPDASEIGVLNAMSYIAGVVSGPVAAWTADKWGRKFNMRYYSITMLIGTVLGCIAGIPQLEGHGYALFCISKFIIGSGLATGLMTMQILLQEISHPRQRPVVAAGFNQSWTLGSVLSAWISFGTSGLKDSWQWRCPYIVQSIFAIYIVVAIQFMPESPRWLASKGRNEEALGYLIKYHGNGDSEDPLVKLEWAELTTALEAEKAAQQEKWSELLKVPSNRMRLWHAALFTLAPQLNGATIINFYYSAVLTSVGITGAAVQTGIGAGLSMWSWSVQIVSYWAMTRIKRRTQVLTAWPFLLIFIVCIAVSSALFDKNGDEKAGIAAVAFVWLFSAANDWTTGIFYSYPAEVQSFSLRAKGMAVWNTANQLSGLYNAYVNVVALDAIGWRYYCVYMGLIIFWFGLLWYFMVETKGLTLEEIEILFVGEKSAVAQVDARLEAGEVGIAQLTTVGVDDKDKDSL